MIKVMARGQNAAEIEIYSPIGENWWGDGLTAKRFRDDLKALGDVTEIVVRINSPGGEVFDGFSIYNALKEHEATVTVYIDGLAASIASVIAMAGDKVYMGEGAMFMVHSPWTIALGDAEDMRATAEMLDKIEVGLVDAYVSGTGQDRKTVEGWMDGETWFTRDEAIAAGLATGKSVDGVDVQAAATWTAAKAAASAQFRAFAAARAGRKPVRNAADEFKVGDRVRVKDGAEHDEMTKGAEGEVVEISTPALGIQFDDMDGVHKWYVDSELEAAGEASVDDKKKKKKDGGHRMGSLRTESGSLTDRAAALAILAANNLIPPQATADSPKSAPADATSDEGLTMTTEKQSAIDAADKTKIEQEALAANAARVAGIRARFGRHADEHRVLLDACIDDPRCTPDQASAKLLEELGKDVTPAASRVVPGADARDKFRLGAAVALAARAGVGRREASNEFNGMSLADLAGHALALAGVSIRGLSRDAIARKVLATMTSSDFPQLLSNTAGKVLQNAYGAFPATWSAWCGKGEVSDFKIHPRIQIGSFNNLATIPEGGEYTYGDLAEQYENAQAGTKGKAIALTRQMIVNDDLGGFTRRAQLMGRAAARTVNSDVYTLLTSGTSNHGPTSTDTGQFFNATATTTAGGHANLTDTGTAISTASIALGRKTMRVQKDQSNREVLNILPKFLVCSATKEDIAWAVLNSTSEISQSNPNKKNYAYDVAKLSLVTDPFLDGINSALPWYLFADPADVAAFEVVFLDGNETPFLDEAIDFDTDAMKFKVRLDYGVALGDWRAGYLNDGA